MEELEVARYLLENSNDENNAIKSYDEALKFIMNAEVDEIVKQHIINDIKEIISDELNHAQRLMNDYQLITGIEKNEN
jgi:rubrerythrin